jgi:hypothetical protein
MAELDRFIIAPTLLENEEIGREAPLLDGH